MQGEAVFTGSAVHALDPKRRVTIPSGWRFADPAVAQRLRIIGQNTEQLPLDVQGRIRISDRLLSFAGIEGKIAFVGAVTYGEVWAAEKAPEAPVDQAALGEALAALDF